MNDKPIENYYDSFMKIKHRGPDLTTFLEHENVKLGFHRLSIMDPTIQGDQPFIFEDEKRIVYVICNGEIYNFKDLCSKFNVHCKSKSDCEIIIHLYTMFNEQMVFEQVDGEFAIIIVDYNKRTKTTKLIFGRDPRGVRPLFIKDNEDYINLCSEMKGMIKTDETASHFPPGYYCVYNDLKKTKMMTQFYSLPMINLKDNLMTVQTNIRQKLVNAVKGRLMADVPLGCLLSGGLDSSLVAYIASDLYRQKNKQLRTFSIGFSNSTDEYWARKVAKEINSDHIHITVTTSECLENLENVIYTTETYDVTTIRASTMQYMLSKWISENTDIKTLLCGDGSDEIFGGYLYFHNAPSTSDFEEECKNRTNYIHHYDGLRPDRCASAHSLEMRVPYLDKDFVTYCFSINPEFKRPKDGMEKWILRSSFEGTLSNDILYRKKEAFSDGVSSKEDSWFIIIQKYIDTKNIIMNKKYKNNPPYSKEAYYYRMIFEQYYNSPNILPEFWTPKWSGNIQEPSARVLDVYKQ
jgi:asparagine synthase (glutamine-hydrolysing)